MTGDNGSVSNGPPTEHECLELLSSQCRKVLLEHLAATGETSHSLASLASVVARSDETGQFQQVSRSLHHVHLPKLDDANVIDYDPNSKIVEYRGVDRVERLLEQL